MKRTCLLVVVLLNFTEPSAGQEPSATTGNTLIESCQIYVDSLPDPVSSNFLGGYCLGLVHGVSDVAQVLGSPPLVCYPSGGTNSQLVRVVVKFLNDHPEALHKPDTVLVLEALNDAYPCQ